LPPRSAARASPRAHVVEDSPLPRLLQRQLLPQRILQRAPRELRHRTPKTLRSFRATERSRGIPLAQALGSRDLRVPARFRLANQHARKFTPGTEVCLLIQELPSSNPASARRRPGLPLPPAPPSRTLFPTVCGKRSLRDIPARGPRTIASGQAASGCQPSWSSTIASASGQTGLPRGRCVRGRDPGAGGSSGLGVSRLILILRTRSRKLLSWSSEVNPSPSMPGFFFVCSPPCCFIERGREPPGFLGKSDLAAA